MSNKNLGIVLLSSVLTFGTGLFAFSQTTPPPPPTQKTTPEPAKDADKNKQVKADKDKSGKVDPDLPKRINKATEVVQALTGAEDKRIPDEMLQRAEGIVVIPNMIKGAFGIGGRYGKGVVAKRQANGR